MIAKPNMGQMKLYQASITPSSRKVRMFLQEKSLVVPMTEVMEGFALSSWYKARYPYALVPMLEFEDGTQLGEAVAICRFIEELHPEPRLMGMDTRDRAVIEMWERRCYLEGAGAIEELFRNSHPLMVDRGLPGTDEPVPQIPALVERGLRRWRRFLEKIDLRLSESKYVAGERFSMADISLFCAIEFGRAIQIPPPETHISLNKWHAAITSRPSAAA
jgi:glutathione S-transferase